MGCSQIVTCVKGSFRLQILGFMVLMCSWWCSVTIQSSPVSNNFSSTYDVPNAPSSQLIEPIEISPAVIPNFSNPGPLPSYYPTFPSTYKPALTGRCPVNFSLLSTIMEKTASDCLQPFAAVVADVVCCPQFGSLLHIFQGYYSAGFDKLALDAAVASDCFEDIINILASSRANKSISTICSLNSTNLTGSSCPVRDIATFEKSVNTKKLLEACGTVDPLKECCRPVCQPAIMEAAFQISGDHFTVHVDQDTVKGPSNVDVLNDCKGIVHSWLSRKLPMDAANTAFRILSACKVNKACPLSFKQPVEVIKACRNSASPSPNCCSSLNNYIAGIDRQVLITNRQAIICATTLGSMLQHAGVMTNIYALCDVDLKDFSVQAYGQQGGCLLRSLPADMVFDNATGLTFTCDLSDNIAAPWPSSSLVPSLSFCAPEMSLPALPTSETLGNHGYQCGRFKFIVSIFSCFVFGAIFY